MREGYKLELTLVGPVGTKSYSVILPLDVHDARERYLDIEPPSPFDGRDFGGTVGQIRKRENRKVDFKAMAELLAIKLGERMEDEEGWHGPSREETYRRMRKEGKG